jgi:nicotinate-nucleotide pyrophosphorylase (carboxylating)
MRSDVLHDSRLSRLIELSILEDAGMGDLTSEAVVPPDRLGKGKILCKQDGVVAGLEVAEMVFRHCDQSISLACTVQDGSAVDSGTIVARLEGSVRGILIGERTALNFLQRMSGIATLTKKYVDAVEGTTAKIIDTRKTAPGLRGLDKMAVRLGGGVNHRFGLDDMILIKDNHIVAAGGIAAAVTACRARLEADDLHVPIEVETKSLAEVREALDCGGVDRIMLDNFQTDDMRTAVEMIGHRYEVEASGGITLGNVRSVAQTGVDFISIGALTHSAPGLDLSLELTQTLP